MENSDKGLLARLDLQTRDDVNILKTGYGVIQRDIMTMTAAIDKLVTRFEETRKTNWPLLALCAGLLPIVIGGIIFFMTSFVAGAVAPLQSHVVQIDVTVKSLADQVRDIATIETARGKDLSLLAQTATLNGETINRMLERQRLVDDSISKSTSADENSRTDRSQLNTRMSKIESQLASEVQERRTHSAETRVQLAEIEQQFHSVSNIANLRAAQQERMNSMMWEKTHPGERYPNGTFFPTSIFQGPGGANNNMNPSP